MSLGYFEKGNRFYNEGNYDEAIKNYKKSIEVKSNEIESLYNLGVCYIRKSGKSLHKEDYLNLAVEIFHELIKKDRKHYKGLFNLAYAYNMLNKYEKAYIYINAASAVNIEKDPDCDNFLRYSNNEIVRRIQCGGV